MQRAVLGAKLLAIVACSGMITAFGSDPPIRAEVRGATVTAYDTGDSEVAGFNLRLGLRLTNGFGEPLDVPKPGRADDGKLRFSLAAIQTKQSDGSWVHVYSASFVGTSTLKYEACVQLPPGEIAEFPNLTTAFVKLRKYLAELGTAPTVRFVFLMPCQQADGKVIFKSVTTDPLVLQLPSRP